VFFIPRSKAFNLLKILIITLPSRTLLRILLIFLSFLNLSHPQSMFNLNLIFQVTRIIFITLLRNILILSQILINLTLFLSNLVKVTVKGPEICLFILLLLQLLFFLFYILDFSKCWFLSLFGLVLYFDLTVFITIWLIFKTAITTWPTVFSISPNVEITTGWGFILLFL
jgi:hypothetical protein